MKIDPARLPMTTEPDTIHTYECPRCDNRTQLLFQTADIWCGFGKHEPVRMKLIDTKQMPDNQPRRSAGDPFRRARPARTRLGQPADPTARPGAARGQQGARIRRPSR